MECLPAVFRCAAAMASDAAQRSGDRPSGVEHAMTFQDFALAGTGVALPQRWVASESLDEGLGLPAGSLLKMCGVAHRYMCESETQVQMAAEAARGALSEAEIPLASIDLVIFAASVGRQPIPSTAPLVAGHLGIPPGVCTAFDVNSTCLSFLTAFDVAASLLATGRFRGSLVVSAEMATRALPWESDPETAGLFGDGAAAAVLLPATNVARPSRVKAALFETHHDGYDFCRLGAGGTEIDFHRDANRFEANARFAMNGRDLFRLTANRFPAFVTRLLDQAGWCREEIDLVVPHQASPLALTHMIERCRLPSDRVVNIVRDYGNQVAASIPTALHLARQAGRVKQRAKVLLLGTSAGVCFGGIALEI